MYRINEKKNEKKWINKTIFGEKSSPGGKNWSEIISMISITEKKLLKILLPYVVTSNPIRYNVRTFRISDWIIVNKDF